MMISRLFKRYFFLLLFVVGLTFNINQVNAAVDSKGTDFFISFLENYVSGNLSLFITSDSGASGSVEVPGLSFVEPFSVGAGGVIKVDLPSSTQYLAANSVSNRGVHIVSDNEVTVYGLNRAQYSTDAFMALPVDALGLEYILMSYTGLGGSYPSEFTVVGVYDNTEVTIIPSATANGRTAGVPFTITLNNTETFHLNSPTDLTGSIVSATAPVGVMSGVKCANVPVGYPWCDHINEMMPAVATWGKSFLTVPLATRKRGDFFRILAAQDNTSVNINGAEVATLNRGDVHETFLTTVSQIEASESVLVAQYSVGQSYDGVISDPFMMLVPPTEQFLPSYGFSTLGPEVGFSNSFVNVVIPTSDVSSLLLDGATVDPLLFEPIGSSNFSGAKISVSPGSHYINSPASFGIYVYGFGSYDSYGYPGGMSFDFINPQGDEYPPNVNLVASNDIIHGVAEDSEDLNLNGILEADEDLNGNGIIDRRTEDTNNNGLLDAGEDLNNNGLLDRDTGIFRVELETGSDNLQIQLTNFIPGSTRADFTISRIDPSLPGTGILVVSDGAGNAVTRDIEIADTTSLTNVRLISTLSTTDIDLDNSSFSIAPYDVSAGGDQTAIEWRFNKITVDQIENLDYDIVMRNLVPGEIRTITQQLDLYYTDVNGNEVHTGLGETQVNVLASIMQINVATDKSTYSANEVVDISSSVLNLSAYEAVTDVRLSIKDNTGVTVATVGSFNDVAILSGDTYTPSGVIFNTGATYEGMYEVVAELIDDNGLPFASAVAPFLITTVTDIAVSATVSTDQPVYDPYQTITVLDRIRNTVSNTILDGMTATTSVYHPDGSLFWSQSDAISQLLPNSLRDVAYNVALGNALPGDYPVRLVVTDELGVEKALSETSFTVRSTADSGAGLAGTITLTPSYEVLKTEYINIGATVGNMGNSSITDLPVTLSIVDPATQQVVISWNETIATLLTQTDYPMTRDWRAIGPVGTTYVVVLTAEVANQTQILARENFIIGEKIVSEFALGDRGRLLILLDGECKGHDDDDHDDGKHKSGNKGDDDDNDHGHVTDCDPHGPKAAPGLVAQREFLENLLNTAGWSYTIVTDDDAFAQEMRSGGYAGYALFSEQEKLDEQVQKELRERVYRGEGLLVAGDHDNRHNKLDDALGIDDEGKQKYAESLLFIDPSLELTGEQLLAYEDKVARVELEGATEIAEFVFTQKYQHDDDDDHDDKHGKSGGKDDDDDDDHNYSNAAVTSYQFGYGHSVYVAFDLLAHATSMQDANLLDNLILNALGYTHPQNLTDLATTVIPVSLSLMNRGTDVTGQVILTMPDDVTVVDPGEATVNSEGRIIWPYGLATNETAELNFWVQIPDTAPDLLFNASIQIGSAPDWEEYGVVTITVRPVSFLALYDVINELGAIADLDRYYDKALKHLQKADDYLHQQKYIKVVKEMLKATDDLAKATHPQAADIRRMVDHAIANYARLITEHEHDHDGHDEHHGHNDD